MPIPMINPFPRTQKNKNKTIDNFPIFKIYEIIKIPKLFIIKI